MGKREESQKIILDKAREVFIENGLIKTVMDDIARAAGMTRRTLYRYFKTKEDLAYETTIILMQEWNEASKQVYEKLEGSGIKRFEDYLLNLTMYMESRVSLMRYLGEFDMFFSDNKEEQPSSESVIRFKNIILESDGFLAEIVKMGMADGSIKKDIDQELTVATISNVLWSFGQQIAVRGNILRDETGFNGIELFKKQIEIYIDAIKED